MADLEFVAFDSTGKELESPQGLGDRYIAKKDAHFEEPITTDSTIDGRAIATDGTKLDLISVTSPVDLDAIAAAQGPGAVILMGNWDASTGLFPTSNFIGETWICNVAGPVDGVQFNTGDEVTALVDGASTTTYVGNWRQNRYNDTVTSVGGDTGDVTITESMISDFGIYLENADLDSLAKLNALVLDATITDIADQATAAQGALASTALQSTGWKRQQLGLIGSPSGSGAPSLSAFGPSGVCKAMAFAIGDSVYISGVVPHDALAGGTIFPIICWSTNGVSLNSVKWELSITFANGYNTTVFPANSVIAMEEAASGITWQHMTTLAGTGIGSIEIGGGFLAELKRVSNGGTDNLDTVYGLFSGFHYPTNKFDTLNKEPPFFV